MLKSIAPSYISDLLKYKNSGSVLQSPSKHLLDELVTNLKTHGDQYHQYMTRPHRYIAVTMTIALL